MINVNVSNMIDGKVAKGRGSDAVDVVLHETRQCDDGPLPNAVASVLAFDGVLLPDDARLNACQDEGNATTATPSASDFTPLSKLPLMTVDASGYQLSHLVGQGVNVHVVMRPVVSIGDDYNDDRDGEQRRRTTNDVNHHRANHHHVKTYRRDVLRLVFDDMEEDPLNASLEGSDVEEMPHAGGLAGSPTPFRRQKVESEDRDPKPETSPEEVGTATASTACDSPPTQGDHLRYQLSGMEVSNGCLTTFFSYAFDACQEVNAAAGNDGSVAMEFGVFCHVVGCGLLDSDCPVDVWIDLSTADIVHPVWSETHWFTGNDVRWTPFFNVVDLSSLPSVNDVLQRIDAATSHDSITTATVLCVLRIRRKETPTAVVNNSVVVDADPLPTFDVFQFVTMSVLPTDGAAIPQEMSANVAACGPRSCIQSCLDEIFFGKGRTDLINVLCASSRCLLQTNDACVHPCVSPLCMRQLQESIVWSSRPTSRLAVKRQMSKDRVRYEEKLRTLAVCVDALLALATTNDPEAAGVVLLDGRVIGTSSSVCARRELFNGAVFTEGVKLENGNWTVAKVISASNCLKLAVLLPDKKKAVPFVPRKPVPPSKSCACVAQ